jgi:hypothetical protein
VIAKRDRQWMHWSHVMDAFETVSLQHSSSVLGRKRFSLCEANRALTLVRRIVTDVVRDYRQLRQLHQHCLSFDADGRTVEAEEARQQYASITDHLSELKEELERIGCELKDYRAGLVDFPARIQEREISFCWKLGESEIGYWHEAGSGYAARRPVSELAG